MGEPASKRATVYEEYLAVPDTRVAEILNGVLHTNPRPASPHARASSVLGAELSGPFDRGRGGPGGWLILDEPELRLHDDILVPDLAGWRRTRMPEMPHAPYFDMPPDWVCEVLSPSTAAVDRAEKLPIYAREGVAFAWLIDPLARTLEAYRLINERWTLLGTSRGDGPVNAQPFEDYTLRLGDLWAR